MSNSAACKVCGRSFEQPRERGGRRFFCERCRAKADAEIARELRVKCKECGKAFTTTSRHAKYCSRECSAEPRRRYAREYQRRAMADPEKRAIIMARVRASAAASAARKRGGGPPQKPPAPRADPNAEPSVCRLCGRAFEQYGYAHCHVYCKECTARADKAIARKMRVKCGECGKAFTTTSRAVRYCSDECSADAKRRSTRESGRRRMADPKRRAANAAYMRAWYAARGGGRSGR